MYLLHLIYNFYFTSNLIIQLWLILNKGWPIDKSHAQLTIISAIKQHNNKENIFSEA